MGAVRQYELNEWTLLSEHRLQDCYNFELPCNSLGVSPSGFPPRGTYSTRRHIQLGQARAKYHTRPRAHSKIVDEPGCGGH